MFDQMSNLQQRMIIGSLVAACILVSIYLSHLPFFNVVFVLLTAASIALAQREYYHIAQLKDFHPLGKIGILCTFFYTGAIYLTTITPKAEVLPAVVLGITLVVAFIYYFVKGSDPFVNLPVTFFGIAYLTLPLSFIILINYFQGPYVSDGRWCVFWLMTVTKITDTGALFIGKKFGRTQLSTYISPKKTWEGALGGFGVAVLTSLILYGVMHLLFSTPPMQITLLQSIWLAILISITAQFGDLAESLLKRNVGIKDSSRLPGLGGILDMVDSMVFTTPLMYLFLKLQ